MTDFSLFLANHAVVQALKRAAAPGGRLGHAYLLHGTAGTGKRTLARCFAAGILCEAAGERPCGQCLSCQKVEKGIHPDLLLVRRPDGKMQITVDQIRTLRENVYLLPNESPRKAALIEGADAMNEAAANALLKVLEEPPPYLTFILTADNRSALPETIASRCICLELSEAPRLQAEKWLMRQFPDAPPDQLAGAILCGGGNLGRASAYLQDEKAAKSFQSALALVKSLSTGRAFDVMAAASTAESDRESFLALLADVDQLMGEIARGAFLLDGGVSALLPGCRVSPRQAAAIHQLGGQMRRRLAANGGLPLLHSLYCASLRNIMEQVY
ncbi:MAG: DNA polymerase III subunit delta' [Oscillospiraceae bacterium]|nr:DNA polymerase III subunit delta' [Oscillospiraceae bacterium]